MWCLRSHIDEVLTTWVSSSIKMHLAHGWPISIWLYVCQINRFMNCVAPNFECNAQESKPLWKPSRTMKRHSTILKSVPKELQAAKWMQCKTWRNCFVYTKEDLLLQVGEHLKVMFEPWLIQGKHQTNQHLWVTSGVLVHIDGAAWVLENYSPLNSNLATNEMWSINL